MAERFDWDNAAFENGSLSVPLLQDETPQWCRALVFYLSDAMGHLMSVGAGSVRVEPTVTRSLVLSDFIGNEASIPPIVAQAAAMADAQEERRSSEQARASEVFERQKRDQAEADERRTRQIREAAKSLSDVLPSNSGNRPRETGSVTFALPYEDSTARRA